MIVKSFGPICINGIVGISGAKNASLPLLVAACLPRGISSVSNVPKNSDVATLISLLSSLGVEINVADDVVRVFSERLYQTDDLYDASAIRASIYLGSLLLGKNGFFKLPLPGGCDLGHRPINYHRAVFESLGAKTWIANGFLYAEATALRPGIVFFDQPSVGATVNALLLSSQIEGETRIVNAAREPEIDNLIDFLSAMGVDISICRDGIIVHGRHDLQPASIRCIPDRIEAGTYILMAAATRGRLTVTQTNPQHLTSLIIKLREIGVSIEVDQDRVIIDARTLVRGKAVEVVASPYPGFPTDLQPIMAVFLGSMLEQSLIKETVFPYRFRYVVELQKMGFDINVQDGTLLIRKGKRITGSRMKAPDLRGGAALLMASFIADGETTIEDAEVIFRGYPSIIEKVSSIGAKVCVEDYVVSKVSLKE